MPDPEIQKKQRENLVEGLILKGIKDKNVLKAFRNVPRHEFMMKELIDFSYVDKAFPIGLGQTISQPYTVAVQTELLNLKKGEKVLEIGTGSGYQAAILAEIGANVYSIERIKELHEKASLLLQRLGYKVNCFHEDGYLGIPNHAPYDKVLITAATPYVPDELLEQLKIGGLLVAPVGDPFGQVMTLVKKIAEKEYKITEHGLYVFVPLLKGKV